MKPTLTHTIGDDTDYDFQVIASDGTPEDVTGWAFWFTVKSAATDSDAEAVLQLTSAAGRILLDAPASGLCRIRIHSSDTKALLPGRFLFDLQCRKGAPGASVETLRTGHFHLTDEITQAE